MTAPASRQIDASPEELARALNLLPGAVEFRFVDRILRLTPGVSGAGEYRVRGDEPFLPGHFPGDPLFPGVLLLEAVKQLAIVVVRSDSHESQELKPTELRSVKILGTARPGEVVQSEARVTGRSGHSIEVQISVRVGEEVVMTGHLTLSGAG